MHCQSLEPGSATLLLNAGLPIETLRTLTGHKTIEMTLIYSGVYDGTLASGHYKAMRLIEDAPDQPVQGSELLALVDDPGINTPMNRGPCRLVDRTEVRYNRGSRSSIRT